MKHIVKILSMFVLLMALQSCGVCTTYGTMKPYESKYYSQMNDLVPCGETEIEVEYSSYLFGLLHSMHTVNGLPYSGQNRQKVLMPDGVSGPLGKATYKVLEEFPEACYFQVIRTEKRSTNLFLGSKVKRTAIIRAYRFK